MMNKYGLRTCLLIAVLLLLISISSKAQNFTSSPYSMYGLGELRTQTTPVNTAMGNAGIGLATNKFINVLNPASYSGLDSSTFIFEIGLESKYSKFKTNTKTAKSFDANLSYLAFGLRLNKWLSTGIGLNPYSTAGYDINSTATIGGTSYTYPLEIIGSGNISRVYFSFAVIPVKNLSIGVKNSFLFGSLIQTQFHDLSQISSVSPSTETTDKFKNFFWEFGFQYKFDLKKGRSLTLGGLYTPPQFLVTDREIMTYNTSGQIYDIDDTQSEHDFKIPQEFGLGIAYTNNKNLLYLLDAGLQTWSDYTYDLESVKLKNNPYVRTGIEYTPTQHFLEKYYKRVSYRLGFQYNKSYLSLRSYQSDEKIISLGFGLPLKNQRSRIDISLEGGKKGTVGSSRLIQEKFFRFRIGFSLKDIWFQQRKYN